MRLLLVAGVLLVATSCTNGGSVDPPPETPGDGATSAPLSIAVPDREGAAVVAAMYSVLLGEQGFDVATHAVGRREQYARQFPGRYHLVPERLSGLGEYLNRRTNGRGAEPITSNDTDASIEAITPLAEAKGITLLEPSPATSQNAFFVTEEYARSNNVSALSDLEGESVVLATARDCEGLDDCGKGLRQLYGIDLTEVLPLGLGTPETYRAVLDGEAQLGLTDTLDTTLVERGLVLLEDDKGIQPAQNLVPAVSSDLLAEHPEVEETLNGLMAELDNETLGELITRVSADREEPEDVAAEFLRGAGLL